MDLLIFISVFNGVLTYLIKVQYFTISMGMWVKILMVWLLVGLAASELLQFSREVHVDLVLK